MSNELEKGIGCLYKLNTKLALREPYPAKY
jgi:hypothetical protein